MRISNYWASATVTVILREGGGQNEITEGVIAGSSLTFTRTACLNILSAGRYYCLYFVDGEGEAQAMGLLFLLVLHWSSLPVPFSLCCPSLSQHFTRA